MARNDLLVRIIKQDLDWHDIIAVMTGVLVIQARARGMSGRQNNTHPYFSG